MPHLGVTGHSDEELDAFAEWEHQAWETRAAPYAESIVDLTGGAVEALLDAAAIGAATRVLDVATGPGVVALGAIERGAHVVAVDQSEQMVAIARAAGIDAHRAGVEQLPFADDDFDAVVAGFLLNHLARPRKGVAEMRRVCRGTVAVSVWDVPDANPALGLFGRLLESLGIAAVAPPGPRSDLYADEARLTELLAAGGLTHITVARAGWAITVDPAAWFDAVAAGTPRTGSVLAAAGPEQRALLRERYIELARTTFGAGKGSVTLPAAALVASGRSC